MAWRSWASGAPQLAVFAACWWPSATRRRQTPRRRVARRRPQCRWSCPCPRLQGAVAAERSRLGLPRCVAPRRRMVLLTRRTKWAFNFTCGWCFSVASSPDALARSAQSPPPAGLSLCRVAARPSTLCSVAAVAPAAVVAADAAAVSVVAADAATMAATDVACAASCSAQRPPPCVRAVDVVVVRCSLACGSVAAWLCSVGCCRLAALPARRRLRRRRWGCLAGSVCSLALLGCRPRWRWWRRRRAVLPLQPSAAAAPAACRSAS